MKTPKRNLQGGSVEENLFFIDAGRVVKFSPKGKQTLSVLLYVFFISLWGRTEMCQHGEQQDFFLCAFL